MKLNKVASTPSLNAYNDGFRRGIDVALENKKLDLKKINPFNLILNRSSWEGFNTGAKDGFLQGIRQREQQRAFTRLKELEKIKRQGKEREF